MLKVDLHAHTADDPQDFIPYSTVELIDRASTLGYDALAITLHNRQLDLDRVVPYARERGIALVPGVERTIRRKHVLLINFPDSAEQIQSFDELQTAKKRSNGIVIAPHPYYPLSCCLHDVLDQYPALFDAVELNAFYTTTIDFNRAAVRWAESHGKPMVGNSDAHRLRQLGTTFSLVDSERGRDAVCDAVRRGRVSVRTQPLTLAGCAAVFAPMVLGDLRRLWSARGRAADRVAARSDTEPIMSASSVRLGTDRD